MRGITTGGGPLPNGRGSDNPPEHVCRDTRFIGPGVEPERTPPRLVLEHPSMQAKNATRPRLIILATVLAAAPILAVSQFNSHARVDEFDSWLFAYYGRQMVNGLTLYADLWDNKPPGIFWMNAMGSWLSGGSLVGIRVLCALAVCGSAAVVFDGAKRLYGWSAAGIATVLASLFLNVWPYHVGCNRPSTFFVLTELTCVALYFAAMTGAKRPRTWLITAGVCGALGACLKQTALAATAAIVVHTVYLCIRYHISFGEVVRRMLWLAVGWLAVLLPVTVATLLTADAALAWNAVVGFNWAYFAPGGGSEIVPGFFALEQHVRVLGLPVVLALATLLQPLLRWLVGGTVERDDDAIGTRPAGLLFYLWTWMGFGVYLALIGPHQRWHYFGVALPPLVMLSAHGVYLLLRSGRRIGGTKPAYHVVVGVVWIGYMLVFPMHSQIVEAGKQHYHRYVASPDPNYVATVEAIRRGTSAGEAIFVFGYGPHLYWEVDRPPAIRYIGTEKAGQLGEFGQPIFDEITTLLAEASPKAIVVYCDDSVRSALVVGLDTAHADEWLTTNYTRAAGTKDVWIRND